MPRNVGADLKKPIILLHEIGERLKLQGDNRFRAQAYTRAADKPRALHQTFDRGHSCGRADINSWYRQRHRECG